MKRIVIGAALVVAGIIGVAGASPASADVVVPTVPVCEPKEDHILGGGATEIPVTAPDGKLISGYCVKSGSINQNLGPEYVYFDPPVQSVTITYTKSPTEKEISHYIVFYVNGAVPVKPPSTAPTCDVEGTVEQLEDTEYYTYDYVLEDGVMTVSVTPVGETVLRGDVGPWTYPIQKLTANSDGTPCVDDPVVEVNPPVPPSAPVPPAAPTVVAAAGPVPAQAVATQLPSTGASSWWLAMAAMGLVLAGSGFVSFSRRSS
jgi:LPXTG-motif cell wall-anchored protein